MSAPSVHQQVAEGVAYYVVMVLDVFGKLRLATGSTRPAAGGDVVARECVMQFGDLLPLDQKRYEQHVKPIAEAIVSDIGMRGVPHSFVAPTWQREGTTMLGDSTASTGADGPVIRAVVFREADGRERLAVLWSARFAAEGSPVAQHAG